MPCPNGFRQQIKLFLLEAQILSNHHKHGSSSKSCPTHGRAVETPFVGGGRLRTKYNFLIQEKERCHEKKVYDKASAYAKSQQAAHLRLTGPIVATHDDKQLVGDSCLRTSTSHAFPMPFYLSHSTRIVPPTLSTYSFARGCPALNFPVARLVSTFSRQRNLQYAFSSISHLKTSEALSYINLLFRVSVSFIPLSVRRAIMARRARLAGLTAGATFYSPLTMTILRMLTRTALVLPFVLLLAVLLASLEITPISGRWRLLLLSTAEEQAIVNKVLDVGTIEKKAIGASSSATTGKRKEEGTRDWLAIMRAVLGEEDAPPGTLLGGRVLDSRTDARAQLVEAVLAKLERGIPHLTVDGEAGLHSLEAEDLHPTAVDYPLGTSGRTKYLERNNAVIVLDRPESNAFSFGFYGSVDRCEPGVIIVFSGAIDEIMQASLFNDRRGDHRLGGKAAVYAPSYRRDAVELQAYAREPSWLSAFFGSIVSRGQSQQPGHTDAGQVGISQGLEDALAVLLAHELAHLVLSHTIESYASTTLLWPQLEKLGWDSKFSTERSMYTCTRI